MAALVAQVSQLEAALAAKTRELSEQQGRAQSQLGSISRVKEQLQVRRRVQGCALVGSACICCLAQDELAGVLSTTASHAALDCSGA